MSGRKTVMVHCEVFSRPERGFDDKTGREMDIEVDLADAEAIMLTVVGAGKRIRRWKSLDWGDGRGGEGLSEIVPSGDRWLYFCDPLGRLRSSHVPICAVTAEFGLTAFDFERGAAADVLIAGRGG